MKKVDAVWLAAAIMTYEKYQLSNDTSIDVYYFKQSDIVHRAENIIEDTVPNALVSSHCVGEAYNYLVSGIGTWDKLRRITYIGEYGGIKEKPIINLDIQVNSTKGKVTVREILTFMKTDYRNLFPKNEKKAELISKQTEITQLNDERNQLALSIKCKEILKYLSGYVDVLDDKKENAITQLNKMAKLCEMDFGLKIQNINNIGKNILCEQLKFSGFESCPTSITIVAQTMPYRNTRFKFAVDLDEDICTKRDFINHHQILKRQRDEHSELVYLIDDEKVEFLDEKISKKIQIAYIITMDEISENNYSDTFIIAKMYAAMKELKQYYDLVLDAYHLEPIVEVVEIEESVVEEELFRNIILYGPSGTGKTYNTVNYAVSMVEKKSFDEVKAEHYADVLSRYTVYKEKGQVEFITFHQSYSYETFVEGNKAGIFKEFCERASRNSDDNYVFIIDEMNRGDISQIFGELLTLIDPLTQISKVKLPYSKEEFSVPQNVHIIGTMNLVNGLSDIAFRRRFHFVEMMPDAELLNNLYVGSISIYQILDIMNKRIELLYDREHTIGHAYFMSLQENPSLTKLAEIFQYTIIPLLQEYFGGNYYKIQLVLGDNGKESGYKFILDEVVRSNDIFKGKVDIASPEQYSIQKSAFSCVESYKGIYE